MKERTAFEAGIEKKRTQKAAESAGQVADSMEVRLALMHQVHAGTMTLDEAQTELRRIQRCAKASGKMTRAQAFNAG